MQVKQGTTETMSKTYFARGKYEIETVGGIEKQRLYMDGSPYDASILLEKVGSNTQLYYLHRDYLGSITQISNNSGILAAEYSYDAWGRMRNVNNWQVYAQGTQPTMPFGMRGYTGHEQLNQFGLINMNARLYDPLLGRFLAPDPQVASPETSNGYNRYMYASDNPMMFVDIDGEIPIPPIDGYPVTNISGGNNSGNQGGNNNGNQGGNNNTWQWFPNSTNNLNNPYGGPNSGYQGGYSGYNGGSGGSGGSGGGIFSGTISNLPGSIFNIVNLLINSKPDPRYAPQTNVTYTAPVIVNVSQKPINLPKPVGSGASNVYAGGGSRRGGNVNSFSGLPIEFLPESEEYFQYSNGKIYTRRSDYEKYLVGSDFMLNTYRHEVGHYLQERYLGKKHYLDVQFEGPIAYYLNISFLNGKFYNKIFPNSKIETNINRSAYQHFWTEIEANTLAYFYFNGPSDWNFKNYPIDLEYTRWRKNK